MYVCVCVYIYMCVCIYMYNIYIIYLNLKTTLTASNMELDLMVQGQAE